MLFSFFFVFQVLNYTQSRHRSVCYENFQLNSKIKMHKPNTNNTSTHKFHTSTCVYYYGNTDCVLIVSTKSHILETLYGLYKYEYIRSLGWSIDDLSAAFVDHDDYGDFDDGEE